MLQQDNLIIDEENGEILEVKNQFAVVDEASANWVLEKMLDEQLEIEKLQSKLAAVTEQLKKQISQHQRRLDGLHFRFDAELSAFAKAQIEGGKRKSLTLDFGTLSFRKVKGGLKVKDPEFALLWAKTYAPNAIETKESFKVSWLTSDQVIKAETDLSAFEVKEEEDRFYVSMGVSK